MYMYVYIGLGTQQIVGPIDNDALVFTGWIINGRRL